MSISSEMLSPWCIAVCCRGIGSTIPTRSLFLCRLDIGEFPSWVVSALQPSEPSCPSRSSWFAGSTTIPLVSTTTMPHVAVKVCSNLIQNKVSPLLGSHLLHELLQPLFLTSPLLPPASFSSPPPCLRTSLEPCSCSGGTTSCTCLLLLSQSSAPTPRLRHHLADRLLVTHPSFVEGILCLSHKLSEWMVCEFARSQCITQIFTSHSVCYFPKLSWNFCTVCAAGLLRAALSEPVCLTVFSLHVQPGRDLLEVSHVLLLGDKCHGKRVRFTSCGLFQIEPMAEDHEHSRACGCLCRRRIHFLGSHFQPSCFGCLGWFSHLVNCGFVCLWRALSFFVRLWRALSYWYTSHKASSYVSSNNPFCDPWRTVQRQTRIRSLRRPRRTCRFPTPRWTRTVPVPAWQRTTVFGCCYCKESGKVKRWRQPAQPLLLLRGTLPCLTDIAGGTRRQRSCTHPGGAPDQVGGAKRC